jgi:hypothetical protein
VLTYQICISDYEIGTTRKKIKKISKLFFKKKTLSSDESLRKYIKNRKNVKPGKLFNLMTQVIKSKAPPICRKQNVQFSTNQILNDKIKKKNNYTKNPIQNDSN